MKAIQQLMLGMATLMAFTGCASPIKNATTETFKVAGNCDMCKENIETAAYKKGSVEAVWNVDSKTVELTYDSKKTNADEILKRIAYAGYDNEKYLAPSKAYEKLAPCCRYDRLKPASEVSAPATVTEHHHDAETTASKQQTEQQEEHLLENVYANYFAVKDALISDDGTTAAAKGKALAEAIGKVDMSKLSAEQHAVWMKQLKSLKTGAGHIAETTDITRQRDHFASLSTAMYAVMKVVKPKETVYYQHCPMYDDGKGADWLSKEKAIKNPYYGDSMLTCGKTTETIK